MAGKVSAMRYAQAVFKIAEEENKLEKWRQDLTVVAKLAGDVYIKAFFENPKIHFKEKRNLLAGRMSGMNPLVLNLVYLLISKGRLALLTDIAAEYRLLVDRQQGIEQAEVITAIPLSEQEELSLTQRLSQLVGKKVVIKTKVDPRIISGMIARIGDKLIDGSTRSKLSVLRKELSEGRV